jgi:hypothetical protein
VDSVPMRSWRRGLPIERDWRIGSLRKDLGSEPQRSGFSRSVPANWNRYGLAGKETDDVMNNLNLVCDFCSKPDPAWRYPARTFVSYCASNIAGESVGDWAACDRCHVLIESDDRRGLAQRSLDELISKHPGAREEAAVLYEELAGLHRKFFEHRSGAAVKVSADAA